MPVADLVREPPPSASTRANEFAAGNSHSPPARTRRPCGVRRPWHLRVRNRGRYRTRFSISMIRRWKGAKSACADSVRTACGVRHQFLGALRVGVGGQQRSRAPAFPSHASRISPQRAVRSKGPGSGVGRWRRKGGRTRMTASSAPSLSFACAPASRCTMDLRALPDGRDQLGGQANSQEKSHMV
jgi:hypothetical protein